MKLIVKAYGEYRRTAFQIGAARAADQVLASVVEPGCDQAHPRTVPVTSAPRPAQDCTSQADDHDRVEPEVLALTLYRAWSTGDRALAEDCADPEVVDDLFAEEPAEMSFRSPCQDLGTEELDGGFQSGLGCRFVGEDEELYVHLGCTASIGCRIDRVEVGTTGD
jgi:hypothetical protein